MTTGHRPVRPWTVPRSAGWEAPTPPACHLARFGETSRRAPAGRGTVEGRATGTGFVEVYGSADRTMTEQGREDIGERSTGFEHQPVMVAEVLEALAYVPSGVVLDATVGGGGHAEAVLTTRSDLQVLGIDRDDQALAASASRLAPFGNRIELHRAAFTDLGSVLDGAGVAYLVGFLFDLGVSSPQLDRIERGFSYREAGPLDMRMDRRQAMTAADVVNGYDERSLASVLVGHADERHARRIARAVVAARPVSDTAHLAEIVRDAIPAATRRRGGHPAKRTFQAVRIEVNAELDQLDNALDEAIRRLVPTGRGAVLSYHSGEDRIVKHCFDRAATGGCICPRLLPCTCGATSLAVIPRRAGRVPSENETRDNPRSASARLRVLERR